MFLLTSYFFMTWTFHIRYNLDFGEVKKEKEMDQVSFNLLWLQWIKRFLYMYFFYTQNDCTAPPFPTVIEALQQLYC